MPEYEPELYAMEEELTEEFDYGHYDEDDEEDEYADFYEDFDDD